MRDLSDRQPALLVIDPQVEATAEGTGTLKSMGSGNAMRNICLLLEAARAARMPVIFTQEIHRKELVDFGRELDGSEPIHCVENTPGVELRPETQPRDGEYLIRKRRYSAFFATDLDLLLRGLSIDTLLVCGFLTDVCVHYSCVDAHQNNYYLHVARDATAGSTHSAAESALEAIEYLQHGAVVATEAMARAIYACSSGVKPTTDTPEALRSELAPAS